MLTWQHVNSGLPGGRFGHSCTLVGTNSLILFGGINDTGSRLNDTWIGQILHEGPYNIKVSWKPLEVGEYVPPVRGAHAACCIGDCMVLVHGGIGLYGLRLGDTWLLDLSGPGCWHQVRTANRSSPTPRSGHTLTWIGGTHMAVLFGGRGAGYEVLNDVWLFDAAG
jgi:Galactose oxidase, central domain